MDHEGPPVTPGQAERARRSLEAARRALTEARLLLVDRCERLVADALGAGPDEADPAPDT